MPRGVVSHVEGGAFGLFIRDALATYRGHVAERSKTECRLTNTTPTSSPDRRTAACSFGI